MDLTYEIEGHPATRVQDLPIDSSAGEVLLAPSMPVVRAMPALTLRMRLVAPEPGGDRLLGEYTFAHTPSPPAPRG